MVHKRSRRAWLRRRAARVVSMESHRDFIVDESVNVLEAEQVLLTLLDTGVRAPVADLVWAANIFVRGEVISDSRGGGSQQRRGG